VSTGQPEDHSATPVRRIRRLEPAALAGVMTRDVVLFGRYWKATTFSSVVQPTIYLLAFAAGIGSLVKTVGHVSYLDYVATGVVATAVLFSSAFPGMFNTFVRWRFQRTYDAMLAAPVDVEELVPAEVLWIALRAGVYGLAGLRRCSWVSASAWRRRPACCWWSRSASSPGSASPRSASCSRRSPRRSTTSTTSPARC